MTTAGGTSGANFLVFAALLEPGDDVLVERPGYDPLLGAARMFGARTIRFDRPFDGGFALDPDRVRHAMTSRTKVIVVTSPHNPTGVPADPSRWRGRADRERGRPSSSSTRSTTTRRHGRRRPRRGEQFITTSSLTKSYGLSSLRAGW